MQYPRSDQSTRVYLKLIFCWAFHKSIVYQALKILFEVFKFSTFICSVPEVVKMSLSESYKKGCWSKSDGHPSDFKFFFLKSVSCPINRVPYYFKWILEQMEPNIFFSFCKVYIYLKDLTSKRLCETINISGSWKSPELLVAFDHTFVSISS